MDGNDSTADTEWARYRLEVAGRVAAGWAEWFEADTIRPAGEHTVIEIEVSDQSELFGRLRRIHDLNLRLRSVTRLPTTDARAHFEAPKPITEEKSP